MNSFGMSVETPITSQQVNSHSWNWCRCKTEMLFFLLMLVIPDYQNVTWTLTPCNMSPVDWRHRWMNFTRDCFMPDPRRGHGIWTRLTWVTILYLPNNTLTTLLLALGRSLWPGWPHVPQREGRMVLSLSIQHGRCEGTYSWVLLPARDVQQLEPLWPRWVTQPVSEDTPGHCGRSTCQQSKCMSGQLLMRTMYYMYEYIYHR